MAGFSAPLHPLYRPADSRKIRPFPDAIMILQLVQANINEIDRLKKFSGTTTESAIGEAFKDLPDS